MFQRLGFRHALASAQLLFFLAVMIPYQYQLYELRHPAPGNPGAVGWDLTEFAPPEWVQVCGVVNAPAWIVFGWLGSFLPERFSWIVVAFMGAGVFLQWYFVGLWRDKRAGLTARDSAALTSRTGVIMAWVGLSIACLSCFLAIAAQVFYLEESNSFLISLTIWCGFFAASLLWCIRRRGAADCSASTLKI